MTSSPTNKTKWNAADYAANSVVQQTWARELMAKLNLRGDERILDVGCGDGKVSAEMAQSVPHGSVVGVDASPQMIEFARVIFPRSKSPNLEFHVMDARKIGDCDAPSQSSDRLKSGDGSIAATRLFDLVFSNAALHWVDDHRTFLRGAAACLRSGGRLVVSCGGKGNAHDVFVVLRPEMRLKRWRDFFRGMEKPYFFHSPEDYEKWLPQFGFKPFSVRLSPKDAVYNGRNGFAAWLRTTWLPYIQRVPENAREEFVAGVTERYLAKHPPDAEGGVHVRMVRLEINAVKV